MSRIRIPALSFALLIFLLHGSAQARPPRVNQVPNGPVNSCGTCHVEGRGDGGPRNSFGQEIQLNFLVPAGSLGVVQWGPALAQLDSDGDGVSNGTELNDPTGSWLAGTPAPGDPNDVTNPGVVDTSPPNPVPGLSTLAAWLLVALLGTLALWQLRKRPLPARARWARRSKGPPRRI